MSAVGWKAVERKKLRGNQYLEGNRKVGARDGLIEVAAVHRYLLLWTSFAESEIAV